MNSIDGNIPKSQNVNKVNDWPIEPTFLSIRAGVERFDRNFSPNKDGLFYANELRGILADASASHWEQKEEIDENFIGKGQIFALFQVVPFSKNFIRDNKQSWFVEIGKTCAENEILKGILENRKILRIHPGNLYPNIYGCEKFRNCAYVNKNGMLIEGKNQCLEMDSRIALLYEESLRPILKDSNGNLIWENFCEDLTKYLDKYNIEIEKKYKDEIGKIDNYKIQIFTHTYQHKGKKEFRPYVGYRCIYSGLMEYFFPIVCSGKVIAVLMHGQCSTSGLEPDMMFSTCRNENNIHNNPNKELKAWIDKKYEDDKKESSLKKRIFHLPPYYKPLIALQLNYISGLIYTFEERIENEIKARSRDFTSDKFITLEGAFRRTSRKGNINIILGDSIDDLRTEIKKLDNYIKNYEKLLSSALKIILKRFNFNTKEDFIRIYAIETSIANRRNRKKDVFNLIGDSSFEFKKNQNTDFRQYKRIIFNRIKERNKTLNKNELLKCKPDMEEAYFPVRYQELLVGFDPENDDFRVEFSFSPQVAYLIWERYNDSNKESYQFKDYIRYLELLNYTLLEPFLILEGKKLERDLENSMRILSHESAQIIPGVIETINTPETKRVLEDESDNVPGIITKPSYEIIDVSRRLQLLNNSFKLLSYIFKEEKPPLEKTDFHRIVYAPSSLYQRRANLNKKQKIVVSCDEELDRFDLLTNYDFLSHIIFNLIDNAIKYGFRGSKILIKARTKYQTEDVENQTDHSKSIIISVINYGSKIDDKDREKMFDLYFRTDTSTGEGLGIGLFLAKKLCKLLDYEIECMSSEFIADYHLPVKFHFEKQKGYYYNAPNLEDVVNKKISKWKISDKEYHFLFSHPTYKNEFIITIPNAYKNLIKK